MTIYVKTRMKTFIDLHKDLWRERERDREREKEIERKR